MASTTKFQPAAGDRFQIQNVHFKTLFLELVDDEEVLPVPQSDEAQQEWSFIPLQDIQTLQDCGVQSYHIINASTQDTPPLQFLHAVALDYPDKLGITTSRSANTPWKINAVKEGGFMIGIAGDTTESSYIAIDKTGRTITNQSSKPTSRARWNLVATRHALGDADETSKQKEMHEAYPNVPEGYYFIKSVAFPNEGLGLTGDFGMPRRQTNMEVWKLGYTGGRYFNLWTSDGRALDEKGNVNGPRAELFLEKNGPGDRDFSILRDCPSASYSAEYLVADRKAGPFQFAMFSSCAPSELDGYEYLWTLVPTTQQQPRLLPEGDYYIKSLLFPGEGLSLKGSTTMVLRCTAMEKFTLRYIANTNGSPAFHLYNAKGQPIDENCNYKGKAQSFLLQKMGPGNSDHTILATPSHFIKCLAVPTEENSNLAFFRVQADHSDGGYEYVWTFTPA